MEHCVLDLMRMSLSTGPNASGFELKNRSQDEYTKKSAGRKGSMHHLVTIGIEGVDDVENSDSLEKRCDRFPNAIGSDGNGDTGSF